MDPFTMAMMGIQGGTALYNTFGRNNPARAAGKEMGKIQGYGRDAYNPFIKQGQEANQQLTPQYQQMAQNPVGQYNDIMNQYQPSAGYQYKAGKLNQMAHNTAAAGGYAGTPGDVQDRSEMFNGLMGEDMQQFLQNIFGIQGQGMQGLEGQADRGYKASGNLADYLGTAGGRQGAFNATGKDYSNQSRTNGLSSLASLIGSGAKKPGDEEGDQSGIMDWFKSLVGGGVTPFTPQNSSAPNNFIQPGHSPFGYQR